MSTIDTISPDDLRVMVRTAAYERRRASRHGDDREFGIWDRELCRLGNSAHRRGLVDVYQAGLREAKEELAWLQGKGPKPEFLKTKDESTTTQSGVQ